MKSGYKVFFKILLLINFIFLINGCSPKPENILADGLKNNDPKMVIEALELGVDPNFLVGKIEYPAGYENYTKDGRMDGIDYENMPLLFWAISKNENMVISKLKEKGADFNYSYSNFNIDNLTPVKYCLLDNEVKSSTLEQVLRLGSKPDFIYKIDGINYSLLSVAILAEKFDKAKVLINNGADVNKINGADEDPIFSAIFSGNMEIFKMLINKGANLNVRNHLTGKSPLFFAMDLQRLEIVNEFILRNIGLYETYDGMYPEEYALENGLYDVADLFIVYAD